MDKVILTRLTSILGSDESTGFQEFRDLFFHALEHRHFDGCRELLDVLATSRSPTMQHACRHYEAIMLLEQRQYDRAEATLRALLAEDLAPIQRARSLMELATLLNEQGYWSRIHADYANTSEPQPLTEVESYYLQALAAYQTVGNLLGQAKVYNNLGISLCFQVQQGAHLDQGVDKIQRLNDALFYHQKALALAQSIGDSSEVAKNRHGLGKIYSLLGNYERSQHEFLAYLAWCDAEQNSHARSYTLIDMAAHIYLPQGQWLQAKAAIDEASSILQYSDDHLNLAEALTYRGNLLLYQGEADEALANYEAALSHAESIRTRLTAPTAQARYRAIVELIYTAPITFHLHHGAAAAAFTAAERARSRVLADLLSGQAARIHEDVPQQLLSQRERLHQQLDEAYSQDAPASATNTLERSLVSIERRIELADPAYAALTRIAPLTAEEVQAQLPQDAKLLTYITDSDDHLWALVVDHANVERIPLSQRLSMQWLQSYVSDHLDGLRQGSLVPDPVTGYLTPPRLYSELYQALVVPVEPLLKKARTTYVVPFGPLHYLPIGALAPTQADEPPLLATGRRVVYAPSATVLFTYCHRRLPSSHHGLLALAPQDVRLQYTQGAAIRMANQRDGVAIVGRAATRQAMLSQAGNFQTLCFLGHAFFDRRHPMSSRLQLSDGSLYASEILHSLRIDADLVVLAACETGRGQVMRGDEILGLTRTVLYAGTPSLLVTLWPVHEVPTRLFLEHWLTYHSELGQSFEPAQALANSQNWLRTLSFADALAAMTQWEGVESDSAERYLTALWQMTHPRSSPQDESQLFAHPFFWSPYILVGDRPST